MLQIAIEFVYTLLYIVYSYFHTLYRLFVPAPQKSVRGQVVVITGGAQGIGRQVAILLAARGAKIVLLDVDEENNSLTADDIRSNGGEAYTYVCDVSDYGSVSKTAALVRRDVGDVNILVNNAGICHAKNLMDLSPQEMRKTIDVNLMAHFWTLKEFLPAMMTQKTGHVVCICSLAGHSGSNLLTDYTASKFAVRGLMEAVARELRLLKLHGIRLTTVYPNFTNTYLLTSKSARVEQRFGKILEPEEVGRSIVDGVLRNKREIFIPGSGALVPFARGILPAEAQTVLLDFLAVRYIQK